MSDLTEKKAKLERLREGENEKKVGFEKLREKLEEEGIDAFITDVRDTMKRVYCLLNNVSMEDVEIVTYAVDLSIWKAQAEFRIKEELHPFGVKLSTLYEMDMQFHHALLSKEGIT